MFVNKEEADKVLADAIKLVGTLVVAMRDVALIESKVERLALTHTTGEDMIRSIDALGKAHRGLKIYVPRSAA